MVTFWFMLNAQRIVAAVALVQLLATEPEAKGVIVKTEAECRRVRPMCAELETFCDTPMCSCMVWIDEDDPPVTRKFPRVSGSKMTEILDADASTWKTSFITRDESRCLD
jgi:hypothetical protein